MTNRSLAVAVLLLTIPSLSGCMINNREWETLKEQVRQNQKGLADLQKRQEEHKVRLEGVDNSIQILETRVDENSDRVDTLAARMDAASLPGGVAPAISAPSAPPPEPREEAAGAEPPTPVATDAPAPGAGPLDYAPRAYPRGDDLYNSAYRHFEKGEFGQAILEFEEYVANYASTELADNAQYWIGECYYAQKDFRQALREFEKVEKNFPKGNKVPAAKLKRGMGFHELGQKDEAARELREVTTAFPSSEEALLAREKLKLWK